MSQIIHGVQNFGCAEINETNDGFKTPILINDTVNAKASLEQSTKKVYADNVLKVSVPGAKVRSCEVGVLSIPKFYYESFLGFKKNTNGMFTDTGIKKRHCIFFESLAYDDATGEEIPTIHYFYDVAATEPSIEKATDTEEITEETLVIPYDSKPSSFVKDDAGKLVQYAFLERTEENKVLYDQFKTKVLLPVDELETGI